MKTLEAFIVEAIQREHGYTQPGIGETVMEAFYAYVAEALDVAQVGQ